MMMTLLHLVVRGLGSQQYCWLVLGLIHLISAQDLVVSFSGNSSRVVGNGVFSRVCTYHGQSGPVDRMEWLLNGATLESEENANMIPLTIVEPRPEAAGHYSCMGHLTSGASLSASAGFLIIYTERSINAPATQQTVAGSDTELQCTSEIPDTHTNLLRAGNLLDSPTLQHVNLEHQGMYLCSIIALSEGGNEIYSTSIQLQVIVPPTIITYASVKATYGNEPETFTISFLSSFESNTTVTWNFNNLPLPSQEFVTTEYANETAGSTSLQFLQLTRSNKGIYTVIIDNNMSLIPMHRNSARTSFVVTVEVPPTPPTAPVFETFNTTLSKIAWNLTNETADAGPQALIVNIDDHPNSPINLNPSQNHLFVETEPGITYTVTIEAINVDSSATSQPSHLTLQPEPPLLTNIAVLRVNETVFNFTLEVRYTGTGGGSLTLTNIMFREAGTTAWNQHNQPSVLELIRSGKTWYVLVTNDQFATIGDVEFSFRTQNTMKHGIQMEASQIIVVPGVPVNVSSTSVTSNSLRLQARLSTIGTSPILSANFVISGPNDFVSHVNVTENVFIGDLVEIEVRGLFSGTSYSVMVFATNAAGRGPASMEQHFETLNIPSVLPLWIILVIAVVGSLVVVILLLLLLISCCCRRQNDRKINLASNLPTCQLERPGPLGATDVDSIHASYYSQKSMQESMQGFVLSPPPSGYPLQLPSTLSPSHGTTISSNVGQSSGPYSFVKPRLQSSPLESEISVQSSKYNHFNFHHSPIPERAMDFDNVEQYSRSMPVLDDPDLSPTMPPNCATDV